LLKLGKCFPVAMPPQPMMATFTLFTVSSSHDVKLISAYLKKMLDIDEIPDMQAVLIDIQLL
jgi:hypothetical protein